MKRTKKKSASSDVAAAYTPTEQERVSLLKQFERRKGELAAPRMKVVPDGDAQKIALDHPNRIVARGILREALGTADPDFARGILDQLIRAATHAGKINEDELNFMLSIIKGIKPADQLETMLAAQMAAVHVTAMQFGRHFSLTENLLQQDAADRAFNKILRTFIMQMEALKRHRTGGEQKVTVQHVSVAEGGQAIVGNVTQATGQNATEKSKKEVPLLTESRQQPMMPPIESAKRELVTVRSKSNRNE